MNDRDKKFTERAFIVMFVLAFLYMGALSAALEGWDLMYTICSWSGMTVLVAAAIGMTVTLVKEMRQ